MPEDQQFDRITSEQLKQSGNDFEHCHFRNCDLSYADLSGIRFADCEFADCNLSLVTIQGTAWQNAKFTGCKLTGVHFSKSNRFLFELNFYNCILDNTVFYQTKNKKAHFIDCSLIEADFTEADLTSVLFASCNFERASFHRTQLTGADLSSSYNFTIDPEENNLSKAKFSLQGLPGLLGRHHIIIKG